MKTFLKIVLPLFIILLALTLALYHVTKLNTQKKQEEYYKSTYLYPHITVSPDDKYISFAYREKGVASIYISRIDGTQVKQLTYSQNESHVKPEFSPDGKQLLFISFPLSTPNPQGRINLINVDGTNSRILPHAGGSVTEALFAPGGDMIYFLNSGAYERYSPLVSKASHRVDIYSIEIDSGKVKQLTNKEEYGMTDLCVFSDGKKLLYCEDIDYIAKKERRPVYTFHFVTLEEPYEISYLKPKGDFFSDEFGGGVFEYKISPNDEFIAFNAKVGSGRNISFELFLMDLDTEEVKQVTRLGSAATKPAFLHKQQRMLFMKDLNWHPGSGKESKYQLMEITLNGSDLKEINLQLPEDVR